MIYNLSIYLIQKEINVCFLTGFLHKGFPHYWIGYIWIPVKLLCNEIHYNKLLKEMLFMSSCLRHKDFF